MANNNLNTYPLPPSMTPERQQATTAISSSRRESRGSSSRRQSSSSSGSGNGNDDGGGGSSDYQQLSVAAESSPSTTTRVVGNSSTQRRQPFDIEQQQSTEEETITTATGGQVVVRSSSSKKSSFLDVRDLFKKPSSSFERAKGRMMRSSPTRRSRSDAAAAAASSVTTTPTRRSQSRSTTNNTTSSLHSSPRPSPSSSPTCKLYTTGKSTTYTIHPRPYKGFSTPFSGLFATSGGLPTADHLHPPPHQHYAQHCQQQRDLQLSHLRTDLCSLPCFGVLQADYTRYLITHTHPPTFGKRMCLHLLTPLALFLIAGWSAGHVRNEYANSVLCTALVYCIVIWIISGCVRGRKKRVMVREEMLWRLRRREDKLKERMEERGSSRERLTLGSSGNGGGNTAALEQADAEEYEYYSEDEHEYQTSGYDASLGQSRFEMNCAHRLFGCYPSDIRPSGTCSPPPSNNNDDNNEESDNEYILQQDGGGRGATSDDATNNGDLCTSTWNKCCAGPCLPCVPCGNTSSSYGCHVQCCGLCALAQEAREANLALPRHLRMIDYVTMEPFLLYYPRIVELRRSATNSFAEHCRATSGLSKLILVSFKVVLAALLVISLSDAVGYWGLWDMVVLVTTFLQSFIVVYCVHWGWHRFDLSVDAVIKYFACGFVLCTGMAFTVELLEYLTLRLVVLGVVWLLEVQEVQDSGYGGGGGGGLHTMMEDGSSSQRYLKKMFFGYFDNNNNDGHHGRSLAAGEDILEGFFERQPVAKIFYILLSSYVMAGLVEEVCKYFGFVMVDHPDFCSERELRKSKQTMPLQLLRDRAEDDDEDDSAENNEDKKKEEGGVMPSSANTTAAVDTSPLANFNPAMQRRSLSSIRSGVTVAMVAVALGFACCENILHIFIYNRTSLRSEITTLVVKSLFPVHPISAAIQSIYVCRRDLEKDPSVGLGRIVLPSMIFHGTYDFALMMVTSSWQRSHNEQYFYQGGGSVTTVAIVSFCVSLFIVMMGGLYYMFSSRAQYARLRGESGSEGKGALSEASFGLLL